MISVTRGHEIEGLSAINRFKQSGVQQINRVGRFRVGIDFAEIPGTLTKSAIVIHSSPMLSGIIGAVQPAVLRLDDCIDAIGISSGNRDTNPAENSIGKTISLEAFPRDAVVFGTVKPAARAATGEEPGLPARLPERCEHDVLVMWIENDIDAAGVFVFGQNFRPCFATVTRAKDAALLIWAERVPQRRYQNYVVVSRIDNQRADLPRIFQPDVLPRFAGID